MNRRLFISTGALAGAGGLVLTQTSCKPKNLSTYVQTIVGALEEIAPLLPAQAGRIASIVKIAGDFDAAYKRGDFANATTLFTTLSGDISTLIADIGVNLSPQIKLALAVTGIAVRWIATLLQNQATPTVTAMARGTAAGANIQRLADPSAIDAAFNAAKF